MKISRSCLAAKDIYCGLFDKTEIENNGELSKYFIKNNHSPIVSEEIFYDVQNENSVAVIIDEKMQDVRPNIQSQ